MEGTKYTWCLFSFLMDLLSQFSILSCLLSENFQVITLYCQSACGKLCANICGRLYQNIGTHCIRVAASLSRWERSSAKWLPLTHCSLPARLSSLGELLSSACRCFTDGTQAELISVSCRQVILIENLSRFCFHSHLLFAVTARVSSGGPAGTGSRLMAEIASLKACI